MSKKNFSSTDVRIYPIDKSLDKRWVVKWKEPTGKPRHLNVYNYLTVAEREKAAAELVGRIVANPIDPTIRKKGRQIASKTSKLFGILEERSNRLEKKTVQSYASHIRNLDAFCKTNGHKTVTEEVAAAFINYLIALGRAPSTINGHRTTFSIHFSRLVKKKEIRKNPFSEVERVRGESETRSYFKSNQILQIKPAILAKFPCLMPACEYMYYLLCRPKELRFIKIENIDFDNWTVKINWSIGKTKRTRFAIIPDALKSIMIRNGISAYPPNYYLISHDGRPSDKCVSANFWSSKMTEILRGLGFGGDYVLYSWKNTGAIHWYKAGIGLVEIQRQIGHSDIKTTMIYLKSMGFEDFSNVRAKVPPL